MNKLFRILLVLGAWIAIAQTASAQNGNWKIGIFFSPDFNKVTETIPISGLSGYSRAKPYGFNFTTGVTVQREVFTRLDVIAGMAYSNKDVSGEFYCHVCDFVSPGPSVIDLRYAEVPVSLRYTIIQRKVDFFADLGATGSYLISDNEDAFGSEQPFNDFFVSAHGGVGTGIEVGDHFDLSITTIYRYSLSNYIMSEDFSFRSVAVRVSVTYHLKSKQSR